MNEEPHIIPEVAVKGIASGLLMMAFFTLLWTSIAVGGLFGSYYTIALIVFPVLAVMFIVKGISLFKIAKYYPKLTSEADIAEEKKTGKWFGIIFGAEGLLIFIGINVVNNLGHPELDIPVVALVVGLHFYPLAKVFKRTIDYYLATWSTIIAVLAIVFSLKTVLSFHGVLAFVGVGIAVATSGYGLYMLNSANKIPKPVIPSP